MAVISCALIRRIPDRISETAPGRTPMAAARPPLVLPGFSSPRSISLMSSMCHHFRISETIAILIIRNKLDFYFGISEIDRRVPTTAGSESGTNKLGARTFGSTARTRCQGPVLFGGYRRHQRKIPHLLFPQCRDRTRQTDGHCEFGPAEGAAARATAAAGQDARAPAAGIQTVRISPADAKF